MPDYEVWKPVVGHPSYMVSNKGRVLSLRSGRYMVLQKDKAGYERVGLSEGKEYKTRFVHQLVLEAYVGPCPPGMETRHLDDDNSHNWLDNLAWGTPVENGADKAASGKHKGENANLSKLTDEQVKMIRQRYIPHSRKHGSRAIARELGLHPTTVALAASGKTWTHIGG